MLKNILGSVAFVCLGFHLVWWGCEYNGSANKHNPVYGFLQGWFCLEKTILIIAVVLGVLYLVVNHWPEKKISYKPYSQPEVKPTPRNSIAQWNGSEELKQKPYEYKVTALPARREVFTQTNPVPREYEENDRKPKKESPEVRRPETKKPAPLSREELKRRALLDLTRR